VPNLRRHFRASAFVPIVLALLFAGRVQAQPTNGATLAAIHIDNFGQVNTMYYRGGQPQRGDYAELAAAGIRTVVDLTSDDGTADEPTLVARNGMRYVHIPMTTHTAPSASQVAQFLSLVDNAANQPVYVHCVGGRHRTGVMTAVYRMTHDGWSADQAFAEMKKFQFGADFLHSEFKHFVYAFHPMPQPTVATVLATQLPGR